MTGMGMMQVAIHEIVDVVAVGNRFMAATGSVNVSGVVGGAGVAAGAIGRIRGAHLNGVLVVMAFMSMVEMAVVEVVYVAVVQHGGMAAAGSVLVVVVGMDVMIHLLFAFLDGCAADFSVRWDFSVACARALKIKPDTCWSAKE
jgi:hypothetical protein